MTESYLSWDVGIANLAFCLVDKLDKSKFKIRRWGIINLRNAPKLCQEKIKNKECPRKAIFYANDGNDYQYYCKMHSKKYVAKNIKPIACENNDKCHHLVNDIKYCNKKTISCLELNNEKIPYCKSHLDAYIKRINKERELKKIVSTNANKIPLQILTIKLFEILDSMPELINVHEVLIENQPTLINPTMKTISALLFAYFTLRGIVEKHQIKNVLFINPSNKLKVGNVNQKLKKLRIEKGKGQVYSITKKLGIKFCKELIKDDNEQLQFLNNQKKPDDLCDAFLQAYYHIFCKDGIPNNIQEILSKFFDELVGIDINDIENKIKIKIEIEDKIKDEIEDEIKIKIEDKIKDEIEDKIKDEIEDKIKDEIEDKIKDEIEGEIKDEIEDEIEDEIKDEIEDEIKDEIEDEIKDEIEDEIKDKIEDEIKDKNTIVI